MSDPVDLTQTTKKRARSLGALFIFWGGADKNMIFYMQWPYIRIFVFHDRNRQEPTAAIQNITGFKPIWNIFVKLDHFPLISPR